MNSFWQYCGLTHCCIIPCIQWSVSVLKNIENKNWGFLKVVKYSGKSKSGFIFQIRKFFAFNLVSREDLVFMYKTYLML